MWCERWISSIILLSRGVFHALFRPFAELHRRADKAVDPLFFARGNGYDGKIRGAVKGVDKALSVFVEGFVVLFDGVPFIHRNYGWACAPR
jgi:hypothetical protein